MPSRALVLDANILIRAVLGNRVRRMLETYSGRVTFFLPAEAYAEAVDHLEALVVRRGGDPAKAVSTLGAVARLVEIIGKEVYEAYEKEARERLGSRDPEDWPILAAALALNCPIWTEDTDFFGCGVATWTSGRIELYFRS